MTWALPLALAAYLMFDRGYAWIHLPGLPLFTGEVVTLLALTMIVTDTKWLRSAMAARVPSILLIAFMLWGLVRTVPLFGTYQLDALRDAALWYYAVIAFAVAMLVVSNPELPERWLDRYRKLLPWFLLWSFPALQLENSESAPLVPDSNGISLFSHKPGNVAVHAGIALAFVWLVPVKRLTRRNRGLLTGVIVLVIGICGTQSRSGLVAGAAGVVLVGLFTRNRRALAWSILAPLVVLFALAWSLDVQVPAEPRPISVTQLASNVASLRGGGNSQLADNVEYRDELWTMLINETVARHKVVSGWGFGPNLALEVGFEGDKANPLRSPHNSHLDILARMGVVGAVLWGGLWFTWYGSLLFARFRLRRRGQRFMAGLVDFTMVGALLILINAYFDPSLESAQVALWLWSLFGLGLGLLASERIGGAQAVALRRDRVAASTGRRPLAGPMPLDGAARRGGWPGPGRGSSPPPPEG